MRLVVTEVRFLILSRQVPQGDTLPIHPSLARTITRKCQASPTPVFPKLSRRVSTPPGARRHVFALHQERVGGKDRIRAHRHAVVHECTYPDRTARLDHGVVRLERAVLLRMTLDFAARV